MCNIHYSLTRREKSLSPFVTRTKLLIWEVFFVVEPEVTLSAKKLVFPGSILIRLPNVVHLLLQEVFVVRKGRKFTKRFE